MALTRLLIVPDSHIPFESKQGWRLMIKAATAFKPNTIISIGDLADCLAVSSHSKDPIRALRLPQEVAAVNKRLDELDALGASRKVFLAGNHESRLERYLQDKAPELFGIISIPQLFKLYERGWEYVPYRDHVKVGKIHYIHDVGVAGRYATYKALDMYQHSVISGHSHRLCYIAEGNAVGEYKLSASFGWLGDPLRVDYMARPKVLKDWALGFGIGYLDPKTGYAYMTPVPLVNMTCVVEGVLYRG